VPEGHTIHRLARDFAQAFGGRPVAVSNPQGRFTDAALLDGRVMEQVDAHGKHLFLGFDDDWWVHVHLGLFGRVTQGDRPEPPARGAVRLRLVGETRYADLRGPTRCALVDEADKHAVQARLGEDPLRAQSDGARAVARLRRRRTPAGAVLLDQSVVAGVGNVYRSEVLHRAGVHPLQPANEVPEQTWEAVWRDLQTLMRAGVRANRIVTTRPEHRARRSGAVRRSDAYYVYRRTGEPCRRCGVPVLSTELAGRAVFWCPGCQKM
jgi:endonuclease-8